MLIHHGSDAARAICDLLPRLHPSSAGGAALALAALLAEGDGSARADILTWLADELSVCLRRCARGLPDSRYPCEEAARVGALVAALGAVAEDLAASVASRCSDAA